MNTDPALRAGTWPDDHTQVPIKVWTKYTTFLNSWSGRNIHLYQEISLRLEQPGIEQTLAQY